jgi:hypothetical protein
MYFICSCDCKTSMGPPRSRWPWTRTYVSSFKYVSTLLTHPREQSSMLGGLSPDDVMSGSGMTEMVRERLSGFIGNLEAVQAANSQGRTLEAKVPVCEYTIESWLVEDESSVVAYGLL